MGARASTGAASRRALAAAIIDLTGAERELQAALDAKAAAFERLDEAQERLEALRNPGDDGEGQPDLGAVFAASVRAGSPCDVAVLERPAAERQEAIERAQRDVDVWSRTYGSCKSAVPARQDAVVLRGMKVDNAAADVVRDAGLVAPIIEGLAELEAQVIQRRLALHFLSWKGFVPEKDKAAVAAALARNELPGDPRLAHRHNWDSHPVYVAWHQAFEALKRDADAPLPIAVTQ